MAKNVRVSDNLYLLAQVEAHLESRSIAQQLEYWAKLGMASARAGAGAATSVQAAVESTRRLDILEVQAGRLKASDLYFVPKSIARQTLVFPVDYREG